MTMHLFVVQSFVLYVFINVCMYGDIFHPIGHVFSVTFSVTLVGQMVKTPPPPLRQRKASRHITVYEHDKGF